MFCSPPIVEYESTPALQLGVTTPVLRSSETAAVVGATCRSARPKRLMSTACCSTESVTTLPLVDHRGVEPADVDRQGRDPHAVAAGEAEHLVEDAGQDAGAALPADRVEEAAEQRARARTGAAGVNGGPVEARERQPAEQAVDRREERAERAGEAAQAGATRGGRRAGAAAERPGRRERAAEEAGEHVGQAQADRDVGQAAGARRRGVAARVLGRRGRAAGDVDVDDAGVQRDGAPAGGRSAWPWCSRPWPPRPGWSAALRRRATPWRWSGTGSS